MTLPKNRSRSMRRIKKTTPSGKNVVHYKRRQKYNEHHCAICKAKLQAVNSKPGTSASSKKPTRLFAGNLCHKCTEKAIVYASQVKDKRIDLSEVEIIFLPYVKSILAKTSE